MTKEVLHFKIGLSGSSDTKKPNFTISVNNNIFVDTTITKNRDQIEYFEFDAELEEGDCYVDIELKNKTKSDTVLDENGIIVDDLLLNIISIEIDEIDLDMLLWTQSVYTPVYPPHYVKKIQLEGHTLEESLKNCVNLGWNGVWKFKFTSPFYIWLLENI
jgi:hypothetical protein